MHLLEAWTSLGALHLLRLLLLPVALLAATLLPGHGVARFAALAGALGVLLLGEMTVPVWVRLAWCALWLALAWRLGRPDPEGLQPPPPRGRAFEAGALALPLGGGLIVLLLAAVWRHAFGAIDARRAAVGVLLVGVGLLHLMMRRHVRRATLAVGGLGVGLELLAASARAADVTGEGPPAGAALIAAALGTLLVVRIADGRERWARSAFVSDAAELQD
jgi:hypothetical protein